MPIKQAAFNFNDGASTQSGATFTKNNGSSLLYYTYQTWGHIPPAGVQCVQRALFLLTITHRNQTRKGAYIISRRPSHGQFERRCCPQAFLRIFSEVAYISTVWNSTLLKNYTFPNHTITIGVCILETNSLAYYMVVALVSCRNGPFVDVC
jgi:hypothetical protein